jgi:hypothetical protein
MPYVTALEDVRIHYEVERLRFPVVLQHGFTGGCARRIPQFGSLPNQLITSPGPA